MKSFSENVLSIVGLAPNADMWAGTVNSDIVNMRNWRRVQFEVIEGTGTTGTTVITIRSSDDNAASNSTAIAFRYRVNTSAGVKGAWTDATTSGFTTAAGGNQLIDIEIASNELTADEPYVFLRGVEGVNAVTDACVMIHLYSGRYPQNVHADATA